MEALYQKKAASNMNSHNALASIFSLNNLAKTQYAESICIFKAKACSCKIFFFSYCLSHIDCFCLVGFSWFK